MLTGEAPASQTLESGCAVHARSVRTQTAHQRRTFEKWEQGRAKPNLLAAALVLLVRKYPDTLARLDEVAAR
jgi:putative transcriptional regulator